MLILDREESAVFAIKTHFKYKSIHFKKTKLRLFTFPCLGFTAKPANISVFCVIFFYTECLVTVRSFLMFSTG